MHRRTLLAAAAVAAGTLVPTGTAAAAPKAKPSAKTVAVHVKKAQGAQARVATLAARGNLRATRRVVKIATRESTAASNDAKVVANLALSSGDSSAAVQATISLTAAAQNLGTTLEQYAKASTDASAAIQQLLVSTINATIAGRDQLIAKLTELATEFKGNLQSFAAQALASLQAATPDQVSSLTTLSNSDLSAKLSALVDKGLAALTSGLNSGIDALQALLPKLNADAQTNITASVGTIGDFLKNLAPALQQTTTAVADLVQQVLASVKGFVTGFFPSAPADNGSTVDTGSTPAPAVNPIQGFIDTIAGFVPNMSGLFGKLFCGCIGTRA